MAVNITNRARRGGNYPRTGCIQYFQDAPKHSVFLSMAKKLPKMTSNQTRMRVLELSANRILGGMVTPNEAEQPVRHG